METRTKQSFRYTVRKVNISLSPENSYKSPLAHLPKIPRRNKIKIRSQPTIKPKEDTYSVAYIGDSLGELTVSLKRFSMPKLSHRQISENSRRNNSPPTFCTKNINDYTVNNYFRCKPLTPASLRIDFNKLKMKTFSPFKGVRLKKFDGF